MAKKYDLQVDVQDGVKMQEHEPALRPILW